MTEKPREMTWIAHRAASQRHNGLLSPRPQSTDKLDLHSLLSMWKGLTFVSAAIVVCLMWLGQMEQPWRTTKPSLRTDRPSERSLFRFFAKQEVTDDGDEHVTTRKKDGDEDDDAAVEEEEEEEADPVFRGPPPEKVPPPEIAGENRNLTNVMKSFAMAKERLLNRIKKDYGEEYFLDLFMVRDTKPANETETEDTYTYTIGRNMFLNGASNAAKGWGRTVRQMKINLLQYLLDAKVQDFVWATAGNAAAAGHGNFFDEQYTMVLQDRIWDLFHSVGLDFVARPYAIGGSTSAPEIAACAKEIFGTDVDMITWDFAMTDGRWYWRMEFFAHRVMMLPNRPTLLILNSAVDPIRKKMVEFLGEQGMAVLRQDGSVSTKRMLRMPDSKNKNVTELASYTKYVRHFKCGYGFETGKGCIEHKFTKNGTCDDRPHQTNWQRGWKWHAYQANVYALFLMEVMTDALDELIHDERDYRQIFQQLETEAEDDFHYFEKHADLKYDIKWSLDEATAMQFYRDPTYCRTALLPAQSRFLGHVFDRERYDDFYSYMKGNAFKVLRTKPKEALRLAYQPRTREQKQRCNDTSVLLNIDATNFFLATDRYDGYQKITVPNDAEIDYYGMHQSSGLIVACAAACGSECAGLPQLSIDHVNKKAANMRVNGLEVESVEKFDNCFILKQAGGGLYWPSNHEFKYEIEVEITSKNKHIEFTSFIVF